MALAPTSSKTSTGSVSPLTGTGPRALTWTKPFDQPQRRGSQADAAGVASCSIRAARCVVWPMAE